MLGSIPEVGSEGSFSLRGTVKAMITTLKVENVCPMCGGDCSLQFPMGQPLKLPFRPCPLYEVNSVMPDFDLAVIPFGIKVHGSLTMILNRRPGEELLNMRMFK